MITPSKERPRPHKQRRWNRFDVINPLPDVWWYQEKPFGHERPTQAYGDYRRWGNVRRDFLGHSITSNCPLTHFDGTQLCGRDFKARCTAYAIKSPICALSSRKCSFTYCYPTMSFWILHTPVAFQVTRSLANRARLGCASKATAVVPKY
ncbi:hypothetical protein TNCV_3230221 [Trichonephila clavipes]|nr:hypothetical protein TNCV_3230221 [Trichonephila clavipes]